MDEPQDERDLAERQAEIAAAMEETERRQAALRRRQDALLEELKKIDGALNGERPPDG